MEASHAYMFRWLLVVLLFVFEALHPSESFTFTKKPPNPTLVVEGVNSSRVSLVWEFTASLSTYGVTISRQKPGEVGETQLAVRTQSNAFSFVKDEYRADYEARLPATLVLKDVTRNKDEYVYIIKILSSAIERAEDIVSVDVLVPPKITILQTRKPLLTIGQNYTLRCNASGDPHPKIYWTKDGTPGNQLNVTGFLLHLVKAKREDAGSYRCTASNGYGDDATGVSIVGIRCNDCENLKVGITLQSEDWKSAFNNRESVEFKTLESKLLSEISSVYTNNPGKQLYRLSVDQFRAGSVVAIVELVFGKPINDPLKPLQDEIKDGKLGSFTVDRELDLNTTNIPATLSTSRLSSAVSLTNSTITAVSLTNSTTTAPTGPPMSSSMGQSTSSIPWFFLHLIVIYQNLVPF